MSPPRPPLTVRAHSRALATLLAHVAGAGSAEACGALLGSVSPAVITGVEPVENRADAPERRYSIPASRVRDLDRGAAARGVELVGFFHSHPAGGAVPSGDDLESALPGYLYVIVGRDGDGVVVRAWRLAEDRSRFAEAAIITETSK